jgi:hypothetical protein
MCASEKLPAHCLLFSLPAHFVCQGGSINAQVKSMDDHISCTASWAIPALYAWNGMLWHDLQMPATIC